MKVAMIGHKQIPSRVGGVEVVVENLSEQLVKKGIEVDAYNRKSKYQKKYKQYKGIQIYEVFTVQRKSLDAIVATFFATLKALRRNYDVYHYHAEGPCLMLWLPHLFHKRVVVTIHGLDWQRAKWGKLASRMLLAGEKFAVKYADEIIVLSQNIKKYFQDTYGRETIFIPNGVSKATYRKASLIKQNYGLTENGYLLFLARIVPEKGLHYLIEAYKKMNTEIPLVIAGDWQYSVEYGRKIQQMCEKIPNIIMTGFVQGEMLYELFSNALLYILPSEVEGMAVSLLEAMSYGKCCLVSDIPENMEIARGYVEAFRSGDANDLKEKLEKILQEPKKREILGKKAQEYVLSQYNWEQITDATIKVYEGK